ncbi:protein TolQ [Vulgatibacter incomptus]|uniref:MotA/TolQ/ExbB proton channel family protein n=1 Tax=Vulgatibacter incomptus TaxID=1391653 RepID=A0A0K1PB34_9BACT|nr:protein TolQ [Vulgatibacter incomptus]AKU90339.1 MotA/TolQ/ExbB proton channel family protein [Vulgatibacter incomptus]
MPIVLAAGIDYAEAIRAGGPVGWMVLIVLLLASGWSWAIIVRKVLQMRQAQGQSVAFLEAFWQSRRLDEIYAKADSLKDSPVSQVFRAGYVELVKLTGDGTTGKVDGDGLENIERALRRAATAELTHLERHIAFLGTTASASPFVGLFGTVWGIMRAFSEIYAAGNANLATVAKPISEALIATAVGLFAAIPAVVAYNHFVSRIKILDSEMANFASDFLNIVKRHFAK